MTGGRPGERTQRGDARQEVAEPKCSQDDDLPLGRRARRGDPLLALEREVGHGAPY